MSSIPSTSQGVADSVAPIDYDGNGLTDFLVLNGGGVKESGAGPVELIAFFGSTTPTDPEAPQVVSTSPGAGATGVRRNTDLIATFSEPMDPANITGSTFKLTKVNVDGTTTQITNAPVKLSPDGLRATLDPFGTSTALLAQNTKYKAVVTIGAKDLAGNALDHSATTSGNQQKSWSFTTGTS
jgi:hypothetical protein